MEKCEMIDVFEGQNLVCRHSKWRKLAFTKGE